MKSKTHSEMWLQSVPIMGCIKCDCDEFSRFREFTVAILLLLLIASAGCQDPDEYHVNKAKADCAASCESRGGEFYMLTPDMYCYCSFTEESDGGAD